MIEEREIFNTIHHFATVYDTIQKHRAYAHALCVIIMQFFMLLTMNSEL